ncbi:MAG: hypothetical protein PHW04_17435 [Candidatus Wallbacteria bacterium]|nr:hypothetical protein [Candidatus Wallbacteria bacterium]
MKIEIREVKVNDYRTVKIIELSGDFDYEGEEKIESILDEDSSIKKGRVALNLSGLAYINSTVIGII